ncbi:MAG: dihydrolipoyllysine-residue acetyltransferase [Vulcanimicrobiaceae bacterium]
MANQIDLVVPDIGDFHDIPIIEVLIQPGQVIAKEAPLVTLESEKATMEVPASVGGTVASVRVRVGDKVSQGTVLASVELADSGGMPPPPAPPAAAAPPPAAAAPSAPAPAAAAGAGHNGRGSSILELAVPDIGDFHDVPVIEVLVAPGDTVAKDAPLVTLESEKATMEVPAASAGTVRDVRVRVGDKVSQGFVLVTVETKAGAEASAAASAPSPAAAQATQGQAATAAVGAAVVQAAPSAPPPDTARTEIPSAEKPPPAIGPVHASPGIRRFARELGVDLNRVRGSGPNGRVTRDDVQAFVKRTLTEGPATNGAGATAVGGLSIAPWPKVNYEQYGPVERVPLSRIKKLSAANLHRNWVMIPHVTQHEEADVTELEAFRKAVNAEQREAKVTMLAFVLKAAVAALLRYPEFNAALEGDGLVLRRYYHLGFAADTPGGLVVPVVRDVDKKGVLALARETAELAAKARDAKLSMSEMAGGTFTVSSLGGIGGTAFTPIVNAPEVAILGLSRSSLRPVWNGSAFVPRTILPLSLSYDHRVIDGAAAARFCVFLAQALSDIRRTLL